LSFENNGAKKYDDNIITFLMHYLIISFESPLFSFFSTTIFKWQKIWRVETRRRWLENALKLWYT
jgi:hypothetical protein